MKVIKIKIFAAFSQTGCNTVIADTSKLLTGGCFADILVKYVKDAPKILQADMCLFIPSLIFVLLNPEHVAKAVRN